MIYLVFQHFKLHKFTCLLSCLLFYYILKITDKKVKHDNCLKYTGVTGLFDKFNSAKTFDLFNVFDPFFK